MAEFWRGCYVACFLNDIGKNIVLCTIGKNWELGINNNNKVI